MARWLTGIVGVVVLVAVSVAAPVAAETPAGGRGNGGNGNDQDSAELTYQTTIDLALEDIQDFWTEALPDLYGVRYRVLRDDQIIPYDEDTPSRRLPTCGEESVTYEDIADNAFYCVLGADTEDDVVAYDDGGLFPDLFEEFGPFALVQVLAHEWGHAVQGQFLDFETFVSTPSIIKELQADCFAGAYIGWVDEGDSGAFALDPGDLETGIAGMLAFADPVGTSATVQGAHGSGFDRVNAFAEGFEQGGTRCVEYDVDLPIIQEIPFTQEEDLERGGNLPLDEAVEFGIEDLDLYWEAVFDAQDLRYPGVDSVESYNARRRSTLPECESLNLDPDRPKRYRDQVFYCPDDNFIAYDRELIADAHGSIGDFGAMVLIGKAWATAMQDQLELEGEGLQADCFTGAWAGSIPLDLVGDGLPDESARGGEVIRESAILLSPGDLDEAVMAFIAFSEPASRRNAGAFVRIAAFRTGFFSVAAESDCSDVGD